MDELTRENVAEWTPKVVEMLAMRKPANEPLPVLYQNLVSRTGGPVLSLVSGTGRRALQFARAGYPVTCLDLSEAMVAYTRDSLEKEEPEVRALVDMRLADAREPAGHEEFGLVLLEDWDFAQMLTQDDQLACLAAIREAMTPGGLAVIDTFSPYYKMKRDHVLTGEAVIWEHKSADGRLNRRTTTSEFDHMTQIETMHALFEVFEGDRMVDTCRCTWKLRHTSLWEFELLLKVSGLRPILRCPDFAFDKPMDEQPPFDRATEDFAFILSKA